MVFRLADPQVSSDIYSQKQLTILKVSMTARSNKKNRSRKGKNPNSHSRMSSFQDYKHTMNFIRWST